MNPETIQDYLQRAEMTEAQSVALSHILGELATKSDVLRLEDRTRAHEEKHDVRMRVHEDKLDDRMRVHEEKLDVRMRAYEEKIDGRFAAFEERIDERLAAMEKRIGDRMDRKLEALKAELTWKILAIVTFIVSVSTALNIFLG